MPEYLGIQKNEAGDIEMSSCPNVKLNELYSSPQVRGSIQDFYSNSNGAFSSYLTYWQLLAGTFKDNEHVIGYDIFNDPWPAVFEKDSDDISAFSVDTKIFDRDVLQPLYT
jgi:hypothetical protein